MEVFERISREQKHLHIKPMEGVDEQLTVVVSSEKAGTARQVVRVLPGVYSPGGR